MGVLLLFLLWFCLQLFFIMYGKYFNEGIFMRVCNKCNIPVPDNQASCPQCGGYDFYELSEPSTEEYNRRRKRKMIIGLLICLGVLILILTIAAVGVLFIDTHSAYYIGNKNTSSVQSEYILRSVPFFAVAGVASSTPRRSISIVRFIMFCVLSGTKV